MGSQATLAAGVPDLGVSDLGVPDLGVPDLGAPETIAFARNKPGTKKAPAVVSRQAPFLRNKRRFRRRRQVQPGVV